MTKLRMGLVFIMILASNVQTQEKPKRFTIYPNPSAPNTIVTIKVKAEKNEIKNVVVKVYNLLGQQISRTLLGTINGKASFQIKTPDVQASGIFICRITSDNAPSHTERMVLIK